MIGSSKSAKASDEVFSDDHGKKKEETQSLVPVNDDVKSKNDHMVRAKNLKIFSSKDRRFCRWVRQNKTDSDDDEVAELLNVSWLEVSGKLENASLSPGTTYEVVFVVKMKTKAYGWDTKVNFKFTPPDGTDPTITKIDLEDELKDRKDTWQRIKFAEFTAPENPGNMEFSVYEHGGEWKSGLVIKGVAVQPKKN